MFPASIQNLITQLSKLPEIGPKAATRLVFYLLNQEQKELSELSELVKNLKTSIHLCPRCFNLAESNQLLCSICQDPKRDKTTICVVEEILDIIPLEKTKQYSGLYHVLAGLISPLDGIGPEQLKIKELVERIKKSNVILNPPPLFNKSGGGVKNPVAVDKSTGSFTGVQDDNKIREIILALNPTTEGDTTILYLERLIKPLNIKITRLARGLSTGADLEYADANTLTSALLGRK